MMDGKISTNYNFITMDTTLQLSAEKELQIYKDGSELRRLWDILETLVSAAAITEEREKNKTLYYGHEEDIKKVLIRRLLVENNIWDGIRKNYTQITTERILLFFRKEVFMWSTTGQDYVDREKNITPLLRLPETYLLDLYTENIADIEE